MKLYPLVSNSPYISQLVHHISYLVQRDGFPSTGQRRTRFATFIKSIYPRACPSDCDRRIRCQFCENHEGERRRAVTRRRFAVQFRDLREFPSFIFPQNTRYPCRPVIFFDRRRHAQPSVRAIALTTAKNKYERN